MVMMFVIVEVQVQTGKNGGWAGLGSCGRDLDGGIRRSSSRSTAGTCTGTTLENTW